MGKWKAVQQPFHTSVRLYDLEADLGEQNNIAADQPDLIAKLTKLMDGAYSFSDRWQFPKRKPK